MRLSLWTCRYLLGIHFIKSTNINFLQSLPDRTQKKMILLARQQEAQVNSSLSYFQLEYVLYLLMLRSRVLKKLAGSLLVQKKSRIL